MTTDKPHVALITGASKGLGLAIVEHYVERGSMVYGCSRSPSEFKHPKYQHLTVDVADQQQVNKLFSHVRKENGYLDLLVNNAGIAKMNAFALTPIETARQLMEVNYLGTFHCCQKAIGLLRKSAAGRIVNLSTVAVPMDLEGEAAYAASKSAVESLTRIIAREVSGFGITCNAIGPSPIETDLIRGVPTEKIEQLIARQGIKQKAGVDDVLNAIDFFVLPSSKMISGQVLYLGGVS